MLLRFGPGTKLGLAAKIGVLTLVTLFVAIQLVPSYSPTNPDIIATRALEANIKVPGHIQNILNRACVDCHSHKTRWPWYAKVAPVSWFLAADVEKARKAMNFSEWSVQAGRKPGTAMAALAAACEGVKIGRMPPSQYRLMHSDSDLSQEDVDSLCQWTHKEVREINVRRAAAARAKSASK